MNIIVIANLDPNEKISSFDAFRSVRQLLQDLGEAITRCASRQAFLSTSFFLFWACDELVRLQVGSNNELPECLQECMTKLLGNYISVYIIIEKQIAHENKIAKTLHDNDDNKQSKPSFSMVPHL